MCPMMLSSYWILVGGLLDSQWTKVNTDYPSVKPHNTVAIRQDLNRL